MLASLYKVLWSNSVFTSSQSVLGIVTASRTLWGPVLPLWLSFFSLSMRGCESFPESIPGVSLCLTLPSCALRAFYSSHCSANVTIVSLLGMAQDEKSDFPVGRREHSPSSYMACWLPGSAVALSVDSSRMSHCGKWGLDSGVAWQCAMWAPTEIPQVVCDDFFSRAWSPPSPEGSPFSLTRSPSVVSGRSMNILLRLLICLLISLKRTELCIYLQACTVQVIRHFRSF